MNSEDLDRLFREKLNNHEIAPDERAWSRLEEKLQSKKAGILWRNWSMAIAASLLLSIGIWALFIQKADVKETIAITKVTDTLPESHVEVVKKSEDSLAIPQDHEISKPSPGSVPTKTVKPLRPVHQHKALLAVAPEKMKNYVRNEPVNETQAIQDEQMKMAQRDTLPAIIPSQSIEEGIKVTLALAEIPQEQTVQIPPREKPLKTLFKQLKALKKGEDVSLKELKATGEMLIAGTLKSNEEE